MSKHLVRVGIRQIQDLYPIIVAPRNLFIGFIHEV